MLDIDEKMKMLDKMSMENICLEMDLGDGLPNDVDI